jgi:hypothetical protein
VVPGSVSVQPPLLTNTSTLYSPVVSQSGGSQVVAPGLLTNTSTLYGPTVTVGPVSVVVPLLTNDQTFYGATVQPGQITISAPLLTNASTLYAPSVSVGTATVSPPLLTSANALFAPAVVPGSVSVQPGVLTNTSVLYAPTLVQYEPGVLLPPLLVNESVLYEPLVLGGSQGEGHGFVITDTAPRLWWKRKPKALDEEEAQERVEKLVRVVERVARKQVEEEKPAPAKERKREVREAIAPLVEEMPGFDWMAVYRTILIELERRKREEQAREQAAAEIARIRAIEQDDEDALLLLMSF